MFSWIPHPANAREKRIAELKKEVSQRGFDRHAFRLRETGELPADLQSPNLPGLSAAVQDILLFPPQIQRGWHYVPRQALLFTRTGVVHLLASIWPDQAPQVTCLEACGLLYIKASLILLHGTLEIVAQGNGSPVRLEMEFNTVSWDAIAVPLRQLLNASQTRDQAAPFPAARQAVEGLPYKYFNGVQLYGLLPGEQLEELVFQARTRRRWLHLLLRPATPDTLLMLTTRYLVVIQEDLKLKLGWIISYIPRSAICGMQSRDLGQWSELTVQLQRNGQSGNSTFRLSRQTLETWQPRWAAHGGQWQAALN